MISYTLRNVIVRRINTAHDLTNAGGASNNRIPRRCRRNPPVCVKQALESKDVLLTVARDLRATREKVLNNAPHREILGDVDWLLDHIDNVLAEG